MHSSLKLLMMNKLKFILFFSFLFISFLHGQNPVFTDKCGVIPAAEYQKINIDNWGYGFDDLADDMVNWKRSPFVQITSIGKSVQNRELWQLKITDGQSPDEGKRIVSIHARTHPNEVQSWWATNAIINQLLSDEPIAQALRENTIFYIIPMYNPDGVELEYPRENANHVDIESNWDANTTEKEVKVLRSWFLQQMNSEAPIDIALNMHSAYACKRYFVYHASGGTNYDYTVIEKDFISGVGTYYSGGFQPWSYYVSWTRSTPTYYPESWFWLNYGKDVLALTYEDMNCESAGNYDKTANAILHGIADQFGIMPTAVVDINQAISSFLVYPNVVNVHDLRMIDISVQFESARPENLRLSLFDNNGQLIKRLDNDMLSGGKTYGTSFNSDKLSLGNYYFVLETEGRRMARKVIVIE